MNRRERLMATIRGQTVDRPPVSFYEINALDQDPRSTDPFNIYTHPSWRPLLDLTRERTDRIVMRSLAFSDILPDPIESIAQTQSHIKEGSRFITRRIRAGNRTLTSRTRQDPDVNTVWTLEHLLKDTDDLKAFLDVSLDAAEGIADPAAVTDAEDALADTGIVMLDTPDPLCLAALLFDMADYMVIAMTQPDLFHKLLEKFSHMVLPKTEATAKALPGRLWRIYGPEIASEPYMPPRLFREFVCKYVQPMIEIIHRYDGYARVHCHGNVRAILDDIVAMGADGLDPIEPPPQGDVELAYVRQRYGKQLVLFGNLEASDIENMPTEQFSEKVKRALDEGTAGTGRGFVLMPSSCPAGRKLSALTLKNYQKIIDLVENF